jgi:hypothetical protein
MILSGSLFLLPTDKNAEAAAGDISITPSYDTISGGRTMSVNIETVQRLNTMTDFSSVGTIHQAGQGNASSYLTGGGYGGDDTISLKGASNEDAGTGCTSSPSTRITNMAYYAMTADLTNYSTVEYYVRKAANHGVTGVAIDNAAACTLDANQVLNYMHYSGASLPDDWLNGQWMAMELDVSALSGSHTLYFIGGYSDRSGAGNSETQYSTVRLANYASAIKIGGEDCSEIKRQPSTTSDVATVTCTVPPSSLTGAVDVEITMSNGTTVISDGFIYYGHYDHTRYLLAGSPQTVTLSGDFSAFAAGDFSLTIDGQTCTNMTLVNATTMTCLAPAHSSGLVSANLTIGDYSMDGLLMRYFSLTPNNGPAGGGTALEITGFSGEDDLLELAGEILTQGGKYSTASAVLASGGYQGGKLLNFIGASVINEAYDNNPWVNMPRYDIGLDMTNLTKLSFYARKVAQHGNIMVVIDGVAVMNINYGSAPTAWTSYEIDLSGYSGYHNLTLLGGYSDLSGHSASQTQYSNIYIHSDDELVEVKLGGATCTNLAIGATTNNYTCQTPPHAAGIVDVVFTNSRGEEIVAADGFTYNTSLSMTVDKDSLNLSGMPKVLIADYLTAKVITDNPDGYSLSIKADDVDLVCTSDGTKKIAALAGTGVMVDNHWGYAVGDGTLTVPSSWTGVTAAPVVVDSFTSATDLVLGRDTQVWFGSKVDYSLPACLYTGSVTFTVVGS